MFGHDQEDNKNDDNSSTSTQPVSPGLLGIDDDSDTSTSASPIVNPSSSPLPTNSAQPTDNSFFAVTPNPISPTDQTDESSVVNPINNTAPSASLSEPDTNSVNSVPQTTEPKASTATNDDLINIKRQALQELSPLIDHLEQDSEEKFKTTMMMIQASDDKDLIPQAFNSAKEITDEKKRAQALLDIVNEINYFTHKTDN